MALELSAYTVKLLEEILEVLSLTYKYPRGTTLSSVVHLQLHKPVTRIDFIDSNRHRNIPVFNGQLDLIDTRNVPVSRLIIYNTGNGGVFYDTNRDFGDLNANTPISPSSSWEIISDYPSIHSLNLVVDPQGTSDATVRFTAIV